MLLFRDKFLQKRKVTRLDILKFLLLLMFILFLAATVSASGMDSAGLVPQCRSEIQAELEKSLPGIEELTVEDLGDIPKWLNAGSGDARVSVLQVGCWNRRSGIVPVQLELAADGGKKVGRWFKVKVSGKERVLLARRDLVRGEPVQSSDFVAMLVDCQKLGQESVSSMPDGMIYQLTSHLRAGEALLSRRLRPYRLIKRGDLVQVFLQQGGININTRGVAMANGTLKEIITVKNPTSRKYYQARVVGSDEVVVVY